MHIITKTTTIIKNNNKSFCSNDIRFPMIKYCFLKFRVALLTLGSELSGINVQAWCSGSGAHTREKTTCSHSQVFKYRCFVTPLGVSYRRTRSHKKKTNKHFTHFPSDRGGKIGADVCCWFDPSEGRRLFSSRRPEFNLRLPKLKISWGRLCAFVIFKTNI